MSSRKRTANSDHVSAKDVETFERLQAQLEGFHSEIETLVRKSPNDLLNKFKLQLVNAVLVRANALLAERYQPFPEFLTFADEQPPSNSDVMLILSQYLAAMESMRADHIVQNSIYWYWKIDGRESEIETRAPQKLAKR